MQAACSDVRSILKASVEEIFAPDVVMFDPRFEELLHGQAAVTTALVGLSRLYEKRSYKVFHYTCQHWSVADAHADAHACRSTELGS